MLIPVFTPDDPDRHTSESLALSSAIGPISVTTCIDPPAPNQLPRLLDHRVDLRAKFAAEAGLTLIQASGTADRRVIVQDFYRAAPCETSEGAHVLYGASVRLVVDVEAVDASAQLSLPVIAAKVQVGMARAMYRLDVRGYVGPVGDLLPKPGDLDVENFVGLMTSVEKLRSLISDDVENIKPELLFLDLPETGADEDADRRYAVGTTFALSQIATGNSIEKSKRVVNWENWASEARDAIESTYEHIVGGREHDREPHDSARSHASSYLGRLRLRD